MGFVLLLIRAYLRALALIAPRFGGRQAYKIFSTPRTRRALPPWAGDIMERAETFEVPVGDIHVRAYRWAGPEGASRILLVHGWESRAARLAAWVEPLQEAGFEVVAFDAPAHGESEGQRANPLAFVRAMQAVAQQVGPIHGCVGHSLGGFSVLMNAVAPPQLGLEDRQEELFPLKRLVVLAGAESGVDAMTMFSELLGLGRRFPARILDAAAEEAGAPIRDFDAHRTFPSRPIPTLWFHDPEDTDVPLEAAERVERSCSHVELRRTHGLGHHKIVRDAEVIQQGVSFLTTAGDSSVAA